MSQTKSLCAKIPVELHDKITTDKENSALTINEFMVHLITEYYEMLQKGGKDMSDKNIRTLAIQVPAELMNRLDAHLEATGMKKKTFITNILEKALAEAEREVFSNTDTPQGESEQG